MNDPNCLFCKIVAGSLGGPPLYQDEWVTAFRDINPKAPTHILIVPNEHIATINDVEPRHAELVGRMVLAAQGIAADEGCAEPGYRLVFNVNADAGQTVFHIHLHLLAGRHLGWPPG
ncbi:MAG: histidine triad nucleotide-binding protein [Chromatiales bacterium]|nr:histidine triad nucleotide-binding protein [Chromatiales bacterium]